MTRREGVGHVPPLFSVIIPTYNRPDLLRCAVESVLTQTVQDLELTVVGDGSPTPVQIGALLTLVWVTLGERVFVRVGVGG